MWELGIKEGLGLWALEEPELTIDAGLARRLGFASQVCMDLVWCVVM